jgi:hypothetical protein
MAPLRTIHVLDSHRWLATQLLDPHRPDQVRIAPTPESADVVLYLVPPWPDPSARHSLLSLRPSWLDRLYLFSQDDRPLAWAPGIFASVRASDNRRGAFHGGFYLPEHHDPRYEAERGLSAHLNATPCDDARYLWSFAGTVSTAPDLRGMLIQLEDPRSFCRDTEQWNSVIRWMRHDSSQADAADAFKTYAQSIRQSKFVVCPRGHGLSSIRLFEAMQMGRCPVIVSDDWLPPPFVDWDACSIRLAENSIRSLPQILREREVEAGHRGARARSEWERYFSPERRLTTVCRMCLDIGDRLRTPWGRVSIAARAATSYEMMWRLTNRARGAMRMAKGG